MIVAGVVLAKLQCQKLERQGHEGWLVCPNGHNFHVPLMRIAMRGSGPCPTCGAVEGIELVAGNPKEKKDEAP